MLFMFMGMVCAHENDTSHDNIKDVIDNSPDENIKLEEKTYCLNSGSETHIVVNKSIVIEGISGKTIIDGNNSSLYLDVEEENTSDGDVHVITPVTIYGIKNIGKHITFKNITFNDLKLISRHEMEFRDCKFINSKFTSKELNNTFENCIFNKSKIELYVYDVLKQEYYTRMNNCTLFNSSVTSKIEIYIQMVGSSRVFFKNGMNLTNSNLINSKISLSHNKIRISNSKFNESKIDGWSDKINITNTSFVDSIIGISFTDIDFEETSINNTELKFHAGYYAKGCEVNLKNSTANNSTFGFYKDMQSGQSKFTIQNSSVENCEIKTSDTEIKADNTDFNKSNLELYYSDLKLHNSIFYNDGDMAGTIKTVTEESYPVWDENGSASEKSITCLVNTTYTSQDSYFINGSGKYLIKDSDINVDTLYRVTFNNGPYLINENITFNVKDHNGNPVSDVKLFIENPYDNYWMAIITDENGNANYTLNHIGELNLNVHYENLNFNGFEYKTFLMEVNLTVGPQISDIKIIKDFKANKYSNINSFLEVKIKSNNTGDLSDLPIVFKVFTGKTYKTYRESADSDGNVIFEIPKTLNAGNHKIQVIIAEKVMKTTSISIQKARTIVKAPKVVNKFKKSKYFKATIKNKETKKLLSNVKVKIKVYTGKKFKTYNVKTNKKGIAKINTKNLKIGTHKVVISSGNSNYKISAKSAIKIKK